MYKAFCRLSAAVFVAMIALSSTLSAQTLSNSTSAVVPAPMAATTIVVPRHTIIPVIVDKDIRVGGAGDAKQTKTVKGSVAQDIILNGMVIAKAGDLVEGHLTTEKNITKRYFSTDVSQEAALDIDDVVNFCGDTIHMQFERTFVGGVRGGLMSFGAHAHDAVFKKGSVLKAQSDRFEKAICAEKTDRTTLSLPSDMVVPDEEVEAEK